jgi:hypothetical protein
LMWILLLEGWHVLGAFFVVVMMRRW